LRTARLSGRGVQHARREGDQKQRRLMVRGGAQHHQRQSRKCDDGKNTLPARPAHREDFQIMSAAMERGKFPAYKPSSDSVKTDRKPSRGFWAALAVLSGLATVTILLGGIEDSLTNPTGYNFQVAVILSCITMTASGLLTIKAVNYDR